MLLDLLALTCINPQHEVVQPTWKGVLDEHARAWKAGSYHDPVFERMIL